MRTSKSESGRCRHGLPRLHAFLLCTSSFVLFLALGLPSVRASTESATATFSGGMRIGADQFFVLLEMQDRPTGCWLSLAVTNPAGTIGRLAADLDAGHPTYLVEGKTFPLDSGRTRRWSEAVRSQLLSLAESDSFLCVEQTDQRKVFESRRPIALTDFLSARVRLVYEVRSGIPIPAGPGGWPTGNPEARLTTVEIYSLPDWLNGFGDHVTLVLTRREGVEGGAR